MNNPLLILIHGLHQSPYIMKPLEKKLNKAGFHVYCLNYASVFQSLCQHSTKLNRWLLQNHDKTQPIYFVGHSLGGLVVRDFIERFPHWKIANCVTLGTPHLGSTTADYVEKFLPFLIGKAYLNGLDGVIADIPENVHLGVIAGNKPRGLGTAFLTFHNKKYKMNGNATANDGTVYVSETRLPSAKDHIILPVTHTGMLMNEYVAQQTIHFLVHGEFENQ